MTKTLPNLEERFQQPDGWKWNEFTRAEKTIRFGCVIPPNPQAIVICLPGLSEFSEKYFETARDCLAQGLGFYVIDWAGQGKSSRYLANSHKRHSNGFEEDINDLDTLIHEHIQDDSQTPLVMLAHSMGGNIGLRYIKNHPNTFVCAGFSASMAGINALKYVPLCITALASKIAGKSYVPGAGDWSTEPRASKKPYIFSNDLIRREIHNAWSIADSALQIGGVTYGWVYEAHKSCVYLQNQGVLETIDTPCLIASAGHEAFVDNTLIKSFSERLQNSTFIEYPDAAHEILMEKDPVRTDFLHRFFTMIDENILKSS